MSTLDRTGEHIRIDDTDSSGMQDVLPFSTYMKQGRENYEKMKQTFHQTPNKEKLYASYNVRYRVGTEMRKPIAPDP